MAASSLLTERQKDGGCMDGAGTYFLPRSVFTVEVVKVDGVRDISLTQAFEPDPGKGYCLDFLLSGTAEETIILEKTETGLLKKISSRSDDKSREIASNIINTIFELAKLEGAGVGRNGRVEGLAARAQFAHEFRATYDPFNPGQIALVNGQLTKRGFCLMIWDSPIGSARSVTDYCNNPLQHSTREQSMAAARTFRPSVKAVAESRGLMYRPRLPYNYFLFEKRGHDWALRKSKAVLIENQSPTVSLGIDRSFFTKRETEITFRDGALVDVSIDKGSELATAVEIPMQIANSIAALPAGIVALKIDVTNRRFNLIEAQERLIAAQQGYETELIRVKAGQPPATVANVGALGQLAGPNTPPILPAEIGRVQPGTPQTRIPNATQPGTVMAQCRATCGTTARCERHCECASSCRLMSASGEDCGAICGPIPR